MPLPSLTPQERSAALAKAAQARKERAAVKDGLRRGEARLADVLARGDTDDVVGKLRVADMLESLPGVGPVRAAAIMERLDIAASRRLRGLGAKQRAALLAEFPGR